MASILSASDSLTGFFFVSYGYSYVSIRNKHIHAN